MFTEVVKLIPQVDRAGLNGMFNDLNGRFGKVARKFGDGMRNALKFGGIATIATALIAKLLNPLQHAEEVIDRILHKGDDAVTNATELGTTPGKLLRLEHLGLAKGVDADTMRGLLGKFQGALAKEQEAAAAPARIQQKLANETDPSKRQELIAQLEQAKVEQAKGGQLHQFIGIKDTAEAFFAFIQSVQKLEPAQKTVVQRDIFGERIRGKGAGLFNATDLTEVLNKLPSADALTAAATKANELSGKKNLLDSIREAKTFVNETGQVNDQQINDIAASKDLQDQKDAKDLKNFDAIKTAALAMERLSLKLENFVTELGTNLLPQLVKGIDVISKSLPSVGSTINGVNSVVDPVLQGAANFVENPKQTIEDVILGLADDIQGLRSFLESAWAEVKTSRPFKFFGGK